MNKPIVYKIHEPPKGKNVGKFLEQAVKLKAHVPPPNTYNISKNFILKNNCMVTKSPRTLQSEEIAKHAKKYKTPEAATYHLKHNITESKITGCFNFQSPRTGYLEEAALIGKEQAPFTNKKYHVIDPKFKHVNIYKPLPLKKPEKQSLSPTSYDHLDSFKKSQDPKPRFYISKYKYENFI